MCLLFSSLDIPKLMSALEEAHSSFHRIRDEPGKVCGVHWHVHVHVCMSLSTDIIVFAGLHNTEKAGPASG